jgi:hypothetical protein
MAATQLACGIQRGEFRTKVRRYGERHWAVYVNDELLAVTVYKKGALAVQNLLNSFARPIGSELSIYPRAFGAATVRLNSFKLES